MSSIQSTISEHIFAICNVLSDDCNATKVTVCLQIVLQTYVYRSAPSLDSLSRTLQARDQSDETSPISLVTGRNDRQKIVDIEVKDASEGVETECHPKLKAAHALLLDSLATGVTLEELETTFWGIGFSVFTETLLNALRQSWLEECQQLSKDFQILMGQAPAMILLRTLPQVMASNQPKWEMRAGARILPPFALEKSAEVFCQRFLETGSTGIPELTEQLSLAKEGRENEIEAASSLLVSVPDRAAAAQLPLLDAENYPGRIFLRLVDGVESGGEHAESAVAFFCATVARLIRRGGAVQIADATFRLGDRSLNHGSNEQHSAEARSNTDTHIIAKYSRLILQGVEDASVVAKFIDALLSRAVYSRLSEDEAHQVMHLAFEEPVAELSSLRSLLSFDFLLHHTLPPLALTGLVHFLGHSQHFNLIQIATQVAQVWTTKDFIAGLTVPRQSYVTAALLLCMQKMHDTDVQPLLTAILGGVSKRLDSAVNAIRRQGMRVGNRMAEILDPSKPLFDAEGMRFTQEESWHSDCFPSEYGIPLYRDIAERIQSQQTACRSQNKPQVLQSTNSALMSLEEDTSATESRSEVADSPEEAESDSDDSLEAYALNEDDPSGVVMDGDKMLQLRDVAEMIRKSSEPKTLLKGLAFISDLISSAPDELVNYASELVRSLLHCKLPDWKDLEEGPVENRPSHQLTRAMTSLAVVLPRDAGLALAAEIYSPHLDLHQRLLILDILSDAALEMSTPPSQARQLLSDETRGKLSPGTDLTAVANLSSEATQHSLGRQPLVTRQNARSLALQKASAVKTFRNRFPGVALDWVSSLLRNCSGEKQGVDLFGRDNALLGRLLVTLGNFVEAAKPSLQMIQISATILELLKAPAVHGHDQAYVRRCALVTASKIISNLPPSILAGAMIGRQGTLEDELLVERLSWLRSWLDYAAESDPDHQVQQLAAVCIVLHSQLADSALEFITEDGFQAQHHQISIAGPSTVLGIDRPKTSTQHKFDVMLPKIGGLI